MAENQASTGRRGLMLAVAGGAAVLGTSIAGMRPAQEGVTTSETSVDVRQYGPAGDGTADDTTAFAKAIAAAGPGGVQYPTTIYDQQAVLEHNICSGTNAPTSIHGINITHASHVTVRHNTCHDNPNTGIQISAQITATANECHHNDYGLRVSPGNVVGGGGHTVADNNLHDNRVADLQL